MKAINISEFDIIKCGMEFVTTAVARPGVEDLLPHMERDESYVYWMQPKGGAIEAAAGVHLCQWHLLLSEQQARESDLSQRAPHARLPELRASRRRYAQARHPTAALP
jgi:hypothetical protein